MEASLGLGEEAHGLDEGDREKDHAGQQRGDGDGDPHLLPSPFDHLDELAVDVAADAAGLVADEPSEITGLAVEREHGDELVERVDLREGSPLSQRVDLRQTLADPSDDPRQVAPAATV